MSLDTLERKLFWLKIEVHLVALMVFVAFGYKLFTMAADDVGPVREGEKLTIYNKQGKPGIELVALDKGSKIVLKSPTSGAGFTLVVDDETTSLLMSSSDGRSACRLEHSSFGTSMTLGDGDQSTSAQMFVNQPPSLGAPNGILFQDKQGKELWKAF